MREGKFFVNRTDVDDFSARPFVSRRSRHAILHESLCDEEQAFQIYVQDRVEIRFRDVPEIAAAFKPGIVPQTVDLAELRGSVRDKFLPFAHLADVGLKTCYSPAGFLNVGHYFVGASFIGPITE